MHNSSIFQSHFFGLIVIVSTLFLENVFRLSFLDRRISSGIPSSRVEDWQPLLNYRNSLMHGETDPVPVTSKRAYTKRRKEQDANDEDDEENENSDADPDFRG